MQYFKHDDKIIICFQKNELEQLFKNNEWQKIEQEMIREGLGFDDLNGTNMQKITDVLSGKKSLDRDEKEFFYALYILHDFYKKNSEVCFVLKNSFNPKKDKIGTLSDLKNAMEGNSLTDFIIKSGEERRVFQLKAYMEELSTNRLLDFIKARLLKYGNMGQTNLLIFLQSEGGDISQVNFEEINSELKKLAKQISKGQVLVSYNEQGKYDVINQVYPDLTRSSIPNNDAYWLKYTGIYRIAQKFDLLDDNICFKYWADNRWENLFVDFWNGVLAELPFVDIAVLAQELEGRCQLDADKAFSQVVAIFNQLYAFKDLCNKGYKPIFLRRSISKSPDIKDQDDKLIAEVKTVFPSEYNYFLSKNIVAADVLNEIPEGLKNKIFDDLKNAVDQLNSYEALEKKSFEKLVYFIIYFDNAGIPNFDLLKKQMGEFFQECESTYGIKIIAIYPEVGL